MEEEVFPSVSIVVFCYVIRDDCILLNKRAKEPHRDSITIPGGRKERGETIIAACKREMNEESGVRIGDLNLRGIVSFFSSQGSREFLATYFSSHSFTGQIRDSSEGEVFWYNIQKSYSLPGISPFYSLISPLVFEKTDKVFGGHITVDQGGKILAHELFHL